MPGLQQALSSWWLLLLLPSQSHLRFCSEFNARPVSLAAVEVLDTKFLWVKTVQPPLLLLLLPALFWWVDRLVKTFSSEERLLHMSVSCWCRMH